MVNEISGEITGIAYHLRTDFPETQAKLLAITPETIAKGDETGMVETDWLKLHQFDLLAQRFKFFTINFVPGHEGYATAHYEIYLFVKSPEELQVTCSGQL